jgi:hypothetical protein
VCPDLTFIGSDRIWDDLYLVLVCQDIAIVVSHMTHVGPTLNLVAPGSAQAEH